MVDIELLRQKITESGFRPQWLATQMGLSYQGFLNKLDAKTEFTVSEVVRLSALLHLTKRQRNTIFFAEQVDKSSTPDEL